MANNTQEPNSAIGKVEPREIVVEMRESYIDYAMSVIISRALPDVRDGLKPVHRRILYTMHEMGLQHQSKLRKSATMVGNCFVKDTSILTEKGLVPIQDIDIGDRVYTQNDIRKVTRLYEMPAKPLLRVTLQNGLSNIVTFSQKFKVLTPDWRFEWKKAEDLNQNDYLLVKADYPQNNNFVKLERTEKDHPLYLNENIAYLLGLFLSDGSISDDYSRKKLPRIRFTLGDEEEIARKIVSLFEKEFHYSPSIEVIRYTYQTRDGRVLRNKRYNVRINRKAINEFFVSNFDIRGVKALTKKVPPHIFRSPSTIIFSFISGLIDGDGSVHKRRNIIHYGSISERLIDQLQILLLHQGIFSAKYTQKLRKKSFRDKHDIWTKYQPYSLEVAGGNAVKLARCLLLASERKRMRARRIIEDKRRDCGFQYDIIPYAGHLLFGELRQNHLGAGWYQDVHGDKFRMGIKHRAGCKIRYSSDLWEKPLRKNQVIDWGIQNKLERIGSPLSAFLEETIKNKIYFIKVASIEKCAPEKTYDFEVESDHEFVANGVISHNCLGKFHPHGDQAVYDAAMRMAQDFSLRYPLIQGQGNIGSIDDPSEFAAMRYTEMRLSRIGEEMLKDITKDTVDFMDNYDGTRKEPKVLPSPVPQLLLNGSVGIAVGMATNIPPHNLSEVIDALTYLAEHPKTTTEDLVQFIKGPDFPTAGAIYGKKDILTAYIQGQGPIVIRGKAEVKEQEKQNKTQIIITEIPFQVQKSSLVKQFANLVQEKKIDGIRDIRDESDREGMRIVIDLQRDAYPQKILNRLYKFTDLQKTFHLNMLALVDGIQPRVLSLADFLSYFLEHRKQVVERRMRYDLARAKERAHILEGLHKCLNRIDAVIKTIKNSKNREEAHKNLMKRFALTAIQANAILETKLAALAQLERKKLEEELKMIMERIKELSIILKSPQKIRGVVKKELQRIKEQFGDDRRTKVYTQNVGEIAEEDLIPQEETIITLTNGGYIKRINPSTYKIQRRGGKGILGMKTLQDDIVEHFLLAQTHDSLLFFTDSGKVFRTLAYEVPEATRVAQGRGISNFLEISSAEKVLSIITLGKEDSDLKIKNLIMVTKDGIIKKTALEEFQNVRRSGLIAIKLRKDDLLKKVKKSTGADDVIVVTQKGQSIRFKETEIRAMGRPASGVKAITLKKGDRVVGMDVIAKAHEQAHLLVVTENGYGKRANLKEYRLQGRGGSGIKTANVTTKTGILVSSMVLRGQEEDLIVISQKGQVIRTQIASIPRLSRVTQGVKIMRVDEGDKVASVMCI